LLTYSHMTHVSLNSNSDTKQFKIHFKPTVVSLTHHPYFNLNGHRSWTTVDDLHLTVQTTKYLDTDEENVPTGQINDGTGTFMDLSTGRYMTQVRILIKLPMVRL